MTAKLWHHGIFVRAPLSAHENPTIIEFPAKFTIGAHKNSSMAQSLIGYSYFVATFGLTARELTLMCAIDTLARQRRETVRAGQVCHIFESSYVTSSPP